MHQGCVRSRQRRREGSGGVVADIAKLSVGREEYYTRELATDHEAYLSGHGESPGRLRAVTRRRGSCSVGRMAAMPCPPLTWSCGRPRASRPPIPPLGRISRRWSGVCARAAKGCGGGGAGWDRQDLRRWDRSACLAVDGYRLLAAAPTGIATMSLQGEGFEEVATCDRLLGDLDRGREQLDDRTVLVVDEAGMVGSRKLGRLLDHAEQAGAKVVLVGDDRQLAAIDAGGGFRASASGSAPPS
jgi:hypothetical protein